MNAGFWVSKLPTLFDSLERAGFTVTVQSRLAVHDLLLRLTIEGGLPDDAESLQRMIGPIVCTSPSEQEQFESLFQQWQQQLTETKDNPPIEPPPKPGIEKTPAKRSKNARPILTGVVIAAVIAVAVWINERRFEEVRPASDFAPMSQLDTNSDQADPAVKPEEQPQSDSDDTDPELEQPDEPRTSGAQPPEPESPASQDSTLLEETGEDLAAENAAEPEIVAETHTTESKPRFGLAAAITGIGLLLCVLAVCTWWWLSAHWRKRFLVKRSVSHDPEMEHLAVQCKSKGTLGNSFWRTAQRFRQHLSRSSHRLDIRRTAARTAAKGGLFTPVRAEERVSPSYLMLIESDGRRDQQTQVIDNLVDQLESEGVAVTRYYFRGDPRICRQPGGRAKKLTELAAGHHSDRLMVFADARSFLDPMTGNVSPWVEAFESWPERALMVAAESENWSSAEATMSEHFRLAPAKSSGLASLVEQFTPDTNLTRQIGNDRYPAILREHPERWLDREATSQESLDKLLDQLREYLGKAGYQWLSACAVYPTLHHRLTVWTGESLTDEHNCPLVNDSDLMRISRLPWLRQGQLPDWLRSRLIADLSEQQELAIRNRLDKLFRSALVQPEAVTTLPIARDTGNLLQDRRNRGRILRDHTFISFMSNPLSVRLPRTLGRMLPFQRGWQPRRLLAAIALLTFLCTASAFLLAPAGQATTTVSPTDIPPSGPQLTQEPKDTSSGTSTLVSGSDEQSPSAATGVREVAGARPFVPVKVFYATDRAADSARSYGAERGPIVTGLGRVTIPESHEVGQLETPSLVQLEFTADPKRHVILQDINPLATDDFYRDLRQQLSESGRSELLVIIHGFNTTFEDAARNAARIDYDIGFEGVPVVFSWPSQGKPRKYTLDENNAQWCVPDLREFLIDLKMKSGAEAINLMAYDMGNRPLTSVLRQLSNEQKQNELSFNEVVLVAPDNDADVFRRHLGSYIAKVAKRVTLYASANDPAVLAAKQVHGNPRAGDPSSGVVVDPGIETVDISDVSSLELAEELRGVICQSLHPSSRRFLRKVTRGNLEWWVFDRNELNDSHDVQFAVRAQIISVSDAVVGEDMELTTVIVNRGEVEVPSTAVVEVRYVGAFEPQGIFRTLGVSIPPGDSREITFRHIAALKNDFALEVKVHADDSREHLLAESNEFKVHAYAPISAPLPTVSDPPQTSAHITVKGQTQATIGQEVNAKIIVTNSGTVPLKSVVIRNKFDQGLKYVGSGEFEYERWQMENYSSDERAKINAALGRPADAPLVSDLAGHQPITKSIGKLAPGESRLAAVRFLTTEPGKLCQTIQVLEGDRVIASTQHCLNSPNSQWRGDTVESGIRPEQRYSQSVPQVQQRGRPPRLPNDNPSIGNPPLLPSLPLTDRAQQSRELVQRTDDTIRIHLNEPKPPLVPPQDREPYVIEFSDDFNFDARLISALKSWRPFIIVKTDATSHRALGTRIRGWVAAWNEGRSYAKPPKLRGTSPEIRFGTEAARLLGNPLAPPTISARNDKKQARAHALKPYNLATNAGSGRPIQIWLYNRFYTQALPPDLGQANPPSLLLPGEQRVIPSTAGQPDVQQRPLR